MRVKLTHIGCNPARNYHVYNLIADNGHVDKIYERAYTKDGYYDMDDRLFDPVSSGWADVVCDSCGHTYRERVYWGMVVTCPLCEATESIPEGAILEVSNLLEE